MINFICVLKSGGAYTPEYVERLATSLRTYCLVAHRLTVLSDLPKEQFKLESRPEQECQWTPLLQGWKGWWSKIEQFEGKHFSSPTPVIYFDLDTITKADITPIVLRIDQILRNDPTAFLTLEDWLEPNHMNSTIMAYWSNGYQEIFQMFSRHPDFHMGQFKKWPAMWGDQGFVEWVLKEKYQRTYTSLQSLFPRAFVSYKKHDVRERQEASVICFHGSPKPHERNWSWK
jgi:hypothetical protein